MPRIELEFEGSLALVHPPRDVSGRRQQLGNDRRTTENVEVHVCYICMILHETNSQIFLVDVSYNDTKFLVHVLRIFVFGKNKRIELMAIQSREEKLQIATNSLAKSFHHREKKLQEND